VAVEPVSVGAAFPHRRSTVYSSTKEDAEPTSPPNQTSVVTEPGVDAASNARSVCHRLPLNFSPHDPPATGDKPETFIRS